MECNAEQTVPDLRTKQSRAAESGLSPSNRCMKFYRQVYKESRYFIGSDAPVHYFMGQVEQESRCIEGITAFDGGMGLGQFMPGTAEWIQARESALKEFGTAPQPYNPRWAVRALILYDRWLYREADCEGWYYAFRSYNGGLGNLNKEIRLAHSCDKSAVERHCKRRSIRLKNGSLLDLCRVNIEYPYLIFRKAEKYRRDF